MKTQIEKTQKYFATLESGTEFTKRGYESTDFLIRREEKRLQGKEGIRFASWETVISNPDRFNVERVEIFYKVPTTKVTTVDVLEMVKNGCTVEEIEKAIYTTTKEIRIRIK